MKYTPHIIIDLKRKLLESPIYFIDGSRDQVPQRIESDFLRGIESDFITKYG